MVDIPKGWKLVPEEPTREMEFQALIAFITHLQEYREGDERLLEKYKDEPQAISGLKHMRMGAEMRNGAEMASIYRAMIKAAPPPLRIVSGAGD